MLASACSYPDGPSAKESLEIKLFWRKDQIPSYILCIILMFHFVGWFQVQQSQEAKSKFSTFPINIIIISIFELQNYSSICHPLSSSISLFTTCAFFVGHKCNVVASCIETMWHGEFIECDPFAQKCGTSAVKLETNHRFHTVEDGKTEVSYVILCIQILFNYHLWLKKFIKKFKTLKILWTKMIVG